jgi:undecaprenyl diphosphate synthase
MDGNGRWARTRRLQRLRGHENGAKSLRRITRYCRSIGIREITFFALSTENFERRPRREVSLLTKLLKSYLVSERDELQENQIRLKSIGHTEAFPPSVRAELAETERLTKNYTAMTLRLALNYGGRQEILDAISTLAAEVQSGRLTAEEVQSLGEQGFRKYLYDSEMSEPDLLIRTAGEYRLSNFLLWQCSYTELWVTEDLWPDFDLPRLKEALHDFCARERKYGAISPVREAAPGEANTLGEDRGSSEPMGSSEPLGFSETLGHGQPRGE